MSYNGNTIPLDRIIWKTMNHKLASELTYEEAAEYAIDFIEDVGSPVILEKVVEKIPICEFKGKLPLNIMNIRGVRYLRDEDCPNEDSIAMTPATDIYHQSYNVDGIPNIYINRTDHNLDDGILDYNNNYSDITYTIQKGIIQTSFEEGYAQISYDRIAVDENDFPLVPDQRTFKRGLEYYILYRYIEPLWEIGKIADKVFYRIEQQYLWYLASTQNSLTMPDIATMEKIGNTINRLIINSTSHENFFRNNGKRERIKRFQ